MSILKKAYWVTVIENSCGKWAEPTALFLLLRGIDWTKVQPYKINRADGSIASCESSVGATNVVAMDFNGLHKK